MTPIVRPSARVLVLDDRDRLLLFRIVDPTIDAPIIWLTPGGAIEAGETFEQAAARELWEETGIVAPVGPCVWTRSHVFRWGDLLYEARERFFVVRTAHIAVEDTNRSLPELRTITAHRWWSVPDLAASTELCAPRRLAALLPAIIAGDYPADPIDAGV